MLTADTWKGKFSSDEKLWEFHIRLIAPDQSVLYSVILEDQSSLLLGPFEFSIKDCEREGGGKAVWCGEKIISVEGVELEGGWKAFVFPLPPEPPTRKQTAEGCRSCQFWDRDTGREMLKEVTHTYVNGTLAMTFEIAKALARRHRRPQLGDHNVGYCCKFDSLTADVTPICDEYTAVITPPAPRY